MIALIPTHLFFLVVVKKPAVLVYPYCQNKKVDEKYLLLVIPQKRD